MEFDIGSKKSQLLFSDAEEAKKTEESINADEGVYHKLKDINVYMKFVTTQKRKSLSYYYMTNGERPTTREDLKAGKAYDRGWIY